MPGVVKRIETFFTVEKLKELFNRENRKKSIAVILGTIVLICAVCWVISYNSPASIAQRFAKAALEANYRTEEGLLIGGKNFWFQNMDEQDWLEMQSKNYDEEFLSMADYYEWAKIERDGDLYDCFGDYKITARVSKEKDMRVSKLLNTGRNTEMLDSLDIDEDSLKAAKIVTVKLHIDGEDDSDRLTCEVQLVRLGLSWKVIDWD